MKFVYCLAIFACLVCIGHCCNTAGECSMTCAADSHVACITHNCECRLNTQGGCSSKDDCRSHQCRHDYSPHCIDARCDCWKKD